MKQILWGTDLHYNFLEDDEIASFHTSQRQHLAASSELADGTEIETPFIVLSGDISEGHTLIDHLKTLRKQMDIPIYFVCGNHDYWGTSFALLRPQLIALTEESDIKWLGAVEYAKLTSRHALVGHDGWYDAVLGDWKSSRFMMNDWRRIAEFAWSSGGTLVSKFRELALESARHVTKGAQKAIEDGFKHIIITTHIPPFEETAIYRGRPSEPDALPWYTSGIMGDHIMQLAFENPDVEFTVLCGHTHEAITRNIWKNLIVHVGGAEYSHPRFREVALPDEPLNI